MLSSSIYFYGLRPAGLRLLNLILLSMCCGFGAKSQGIASKVPEGKWALSASISVNPWLGIQYKELELGSVTILSRSLGKHWETGVGLLSRGVKAYGKRPDGLHVNYNIENLYFLQFTYVLRSGRWRHSPGVVPGLRHELYKERLRVDDLGIDEVYWVNELKPILGLTYSVRYRVYQNGGILLRILVPINRSVKDDINRYSLELGYQFTLH
jgi:hypothetical protein